MIQELSQGESKQPGESKGWEFKTREAGVVGWRWGVFDVHICYILPLGKKQEITPHESGSFWGCFFLGGGGFFKA